jgi:hypothetical protein
MNTLWISTLLVLFCSSVGVTHAQSSGSGSPEAAPAPGDGSPTGSGTAGQPLVIPESQLQIAFQFLKDYTDPQPQANQLIEPVLASAVSLIMQQSKIL